MHGYHIPVVENIDINMLNLTWSQMKSNCINNSKHVANDFLHVYPLFYRHCGIGYVHMIC